MLKRKSKAISPLCANFVATKNENLKQKKPATFEVVGFLFAARCAECGDNQGAHGH